MNITNLRNICDFLIKNYGENVPMYMVFCDEYGRRKYVDYVVDMAHGSDGELFLLNTIVQKFEMANK